MSGIREIEVKDDDDGQRLDRWIKRYAPDIPFVLAQKLIRKGQIRIDKKRAKANTRLNKGQVVRLPPYVSDSGKTQSGLSPSRMSKKMSQKDIDFIRSLVLHDDGDVIALNKPAGLAVQGGTKTKRHIDGMLDALKNEDGVRPRLVHRLDKDTSGVLLLARSAKVAKKLGDMFKGRDIRKTYWALVAPTPDPYEGTIKAPLAKGGGAGREKMHVDDEDGKFALTEYAVVDHAADTAAFVAFWPRTGRTHQIRVHAQILGTPVVGDGKYGGTDAQIEGLDHAKRLHLHAHRLVCRHPARKGMLDIMAPLPPDLVKSWKQLGFNPSYKADPFADLDT